MADTGLSRLDGPPLEVQPAEYFFELSEREVGKFLDKATGVYRFCEYTLGMLLFRVWKQKLWQRPDFCRKADFYVNFDAWIFGEYGFSARKGRYLVEIARRVVELKLEDKTVTRLMSKGWTKARHLLKAKSKMQLIDWQGRTEDMTELEVACFIKKKRSETPKGEGRLENPVTLRIVFNHEVDYDFFLGAIRIVERRYGECNLNQAIGKICARYIAASLPGEGEEIPVELDMAIRSLEHHYGVKLEVVDEDVP